MGKNFSLKPENLSLILTTSLIPDVHKLVNNKCPAYMKEDFVNVKDFHKHQARLNNILLFQTVKVLRITDFSVVLSTF